jgi:hypothetical protein
MFYRRKKLEDNLKKELSKNDFNFEKIIHYINEYEKDNLKTIEKLKRERRVDNRKIKGAIRQTINVHGPITKDLIGSLTKRIIGSLLSDTKKENNSLIKIKTVFISMIIIIITYLIYKICFA